MTTETTQYPHTIYATADDWGRDTYYEDYDSMQGTIESLKDAGGEDWNDIDIGDCEQYDFQGTHGDLGIYRITTQHATEYVAFRANGDGTFEVAAREYVEHRAFPPMSEIIEALELA